MSSAFMEVFIVVEMIGIQMTLIVPSSFLLER
jgi:hypothetical protein